MAPPLTQLHHFGINMCFARLTIKISQFALKWILSFDEVTVAIPGAINSNQVNINAMASELKNINHHKKSIRNSFPFIIASCATLSPERVEQVLFGWNEKIMHGCHLKRPVEFLSMPGLIDKLFLCLFNLLINCLNQFDLTQHFDRNSQNLIILELTLLTMT